MGAVFGGTFLFAPPKLHETGTIQKNWNRATVYAETKRVRKRTTLRDIRAGMRTEKLQNVRTPSPRGY